MSLLEKLKDGLLVGDGAMGTLLYSHGIDHCFEHLNITHEEEIYNIHKAYVEAGANVIQTNTYAANRIKLARYGYENLVKEINQKAVQIARKAAKEETFVVGTIGGISGVQQNAFPSEDIPFAFVEQLNALLTEKLDGFLLETFYDLEELLFVIKLIKEKTNLPIIAQLTLQEISTLQDGTDLNEAFKQLESAGAHVIGLNCRFGPHHLTESLESVQLSENVYLSAYPNASLPDLVDNQFVYKTNPAYFEQAAKQLRNQGVRLIGGCCGTTPEHIEAISRGLDGLKPISKKEVRQRMKVVPIEEKQVKEKPLHEIAKERVSVIVELDSPRKLSTDNYLTGAHALKKAGADAITLADNSLAQPRISNLAMGIRIKQEVNARPLLHVTCRDRNLIGLQSHLLGLHTLGIDQLLAVTGDPTKLGNFPGATSVYDLASYDLIRLIKQMNEGISFSGQSLGQKTNFSIAGAFNPNVRHVDKSVKRLEKKIACGADYFMTQPLFSEEKIIETYEATKHLNAPIYIGIMPLTSSKNAEFLHHEVPGIQLSDQARELMARCGDDKEKAFATSIDLSKSLIDTALQYFNGIYLITPFLRYDLTVPLTEYIYEKAKIQNVTTPV
ncbi:bifunctional homocysteine S-methyltransferase/methylenetetrahydrofolate reductase [Pueribacillus theae]|uniref:Bifunctional homocysteine S-methyltransferase/methylenetetrahydrofolate reductase n=1 Tax=Pueribacillus theae TaxID=2171751 RepID=A0A2U1K4H5_9BACI|nr:bifunctional homocysteine S-methyltransferase/methylenetetrahydrofolate reductase [Pueribacillus theae]PWA12396.1 bifunctional homocysteine S-methyltransferase/methylenetetrahydrofolate reductase [Pueribacillus theae]